MRWKGEVGRGIKISKTSHVPTARNRCSHKIVQICTLKIREDQLTYQGFLSWAKLRVLSLASHCPLFSKRNVRKICSSQFIARLSLATHHTAFSVLPLLEVLPFGRNPKSGEATLSAWQDGKFGWWYEDEVTLLSFSLVWYFFPC